MISKSTKQKRRNQARRAEQYLHALIEAAFDTAEARGGLVSFKWEPLSDFAAYIAAPRSAKVRLQRASETPAGICEALGYETADRVLEGLV